MEQIGVCRSGRERFMTCVNCAKELTRLDTKVDTLSVIDQNRVIRISVNNVLSQVYSLKFLSVFEHEQAEHSQTLQHQKRKEEEEEKQVLCFSCSNKLKCCYETYLEFNHARDSVSLLSKKIQKLEDFVVTSTVVHTSTSSPKSSINYNNDSNYGLDTSNVSEDTTGDFGYCSFENENENEAKVNNSFQGAVNITCEVIDGSAVNNLPGTSSHARVKSLVINTPEKSRVAGGGGSIGAGSNSSSRTIKNTRLVNIIETPNLSTPIKHKLSSQSLSNTSKKVERPNFNQYNFAMEFHCEICQQTFDSLEKIEAHSKREHAVAKGVRNGKNTSSSNNINNVEANKGPVLRSSPNKNELLQHVEFDVVTPRRPKKTVPSPESMTAWSPSSSNNNGNNHHNHSLEDQGDCSNESDSFLLSPESIQVAVMPTGYNTRRKSNNNSNNSSPSKQVITSSKALPCEIRCPNEQQNVDVDVQHEVEVYDDDYTDNQDNDNEDQDRTFSPPKTTQRAKRRQRRSTRRSVKNQNLEISRYWTQELLYPPLRPGVKIEPIVDIPLPGEKGEKSKPPYTCPYCPLEQQQDSVYENIYSYEKHVKEDHLGLKPNFHPADARSSSQEGEEEEEEEEEDGDMDDSQNPRLEQDNNPNNSTNNNSQQQEGRAVNNSNSNKRAKVSTKMSQAQIRYTFYNCPPYECPYCAIEGATLDVIRNHIKCHHLKFDLTCNYCNEIFPTKANLREHLQQCSKCTDPSSASSSTSRKKTKEPQENVPWICHVCAKEFTSRVYMSKHITRVHGDNVFPCPCCNKSFRTRTYLSRHMDCHVTSRQFVCDQCGGTYKSAHHLRLHVRRTHNPEVRQKLKIYHKMKDREYKTKRKAMREAMLV